MKKTINTQIVADSMSPQGYRITTFLLTYPRFIHAELMTHRVFSRNSASSRAIPFEKIVKMVEEDPFIPIAWQKDHKGMQGTEYIIDVTDLKLNINGWLKARDNAVSNAKYLNHGVKEGRDNGVTKQLCNRLLEPFMWHTVLVTATEWDDFFELRCPKYEWDNKVFKSRKNVKNYAIDKNQWNVELDNLQWLVINKSQAEIHIQALAESMWDAMNESIPKELKAGEWHIPFGDKINIPLDNNNGILTSNGIKEACKTIEYHNLRKVKIATARCAKLSYMTFDGEIDYQKDIELHDRLLASHHMSSFEHCARVMTDEEFETYIKGQLVFIDDIDDYQIEEPLYKFKGWCDNFKGFISYRHLIESK